MARPMAPWGVYTSHARLAAPGGDRAARELEELGFGALWIANCRGRLDAVEPALAASRSLQVGTAVLSVWDLDADAAAAEFHRLDTAYPGRFTLGAGVSHAPLVEGAGGRYERPFTRMRAFLDGLDAPPAPVPADRRMIGANGPKMITLAGERTAGALTYLVTPDHTLAHRERLGPAPILVAEQKVVLDEKPDSARATARAHLAVYLTLPNYVNNLLRMGFGAGDLAGGGSDGLVDALVAWGSPEEVVRRAGLHRDAGADQVALHVLTGQEGPQLAEWRRLGPALG
ncbi:TIGR03620 family F420-dependent LLM class oxidoreductase [Actinomadura physcomitrii]|nr:TIGR03620 family F420-dependent LLM class oxidoreductase [Actinomadura physcomitrii]